jgi:arylsulfatase A-like enzyme
LFVHTFLVHNYDPASEYLAAFDKECGMGPLPDINSVVAECQRGGGTPEIRRHLVHLYDATIAQADDLLVKSLTDALDRLELGDRTIIAVVSDHGEELFDHSAHGHGRTLFQEVVHVPWILRAPGTPAGDVCRVPIGTDRIAPTLRELLSLPGDPRVSGSSLTPGQPPAEAPLVLDLFMPAVARRIQAVISGSWKLVAAWPDGKDTSEPRLALYDLRSDPLERRDLTSDRVEVATALRKNMGRLVTDLESFARQLGDHDGEKSAALSAELDARLRALGYPGR